MRTMAAWMLGAGMVIALLSGCEDKTKQGKPIETVTQVPATPPVYPTDAGARHENPPVAEASPSTPVEPAPIVEPEPVDTSVPHKAPKAHKAPPAEKSTATTHKEPTHKEPSPKESYAKPRKAVAGKAYVVKKGDTLQEISQKYYGTTKNWRRIYKANEKAIGGDPNKLTEGMKLEIP